MARRDKKSSEERLKFASRLARGRKERRDDDQQQPPRAVLKHSAQLTPTTPKCLA